MCDIKHGLDRLDTAYQSRDPNPVWDLPGGETGFKPTIRLPSYLDKKNEARLIESGYNSEVHLVLCMQEGPRFRLQHLWEGLRKTLPEALETVSVDNTELSR